MDKEPKYPLTPALTMLGMAIVLAWLVLVEDWTYWQATFVVIGIMLGFAAFLLILTLIVVPPNQWRELMQIALDTMKADLAPFFAVWQIFRRWIKG